VVEQFHRFLQGFVALAELLFMSGKLGQDGPNLIQPARPH
jgi:hypothetical protein